MKKVSSTKSKSMQLHPFDASKAANEINSVKLSVGFAEAAFRLYDLAAADAAAAANIAASAFADAARKLNCCDLSPSARRALSRIVKRRGWTETRSIELALLEMDSRLASEGRLPQ
jgi:hypothetical protein